MSWDSNAIVDWDELGSVLKHMPSEPTSMDVHMTFSTPRAPIESEAEGEGRLQLPIIGYAFRAQREQRSAGVQTVVPQAIWVTRNVDASTASFISAMINPGSGNRYGEAVIQAFKAGVDLTGRTSNPMIEFRFTDAAIVFHSIITPPASSSPLEVMAIVYRQLQISTAPQQASGLRGAVRTVQISQS
jgi:type VI protein secretion system component Hcp